MDIIINSLYSNREVFLRELISNASDALDKIRFLSLTNKGMLGDTTELDIRISFDKNARTVTITDTGLGMTRQDLIKNLGVVANSGTTAFLEAAAKGTEPLKLIGQFGVGFYSVYLVADKVTVISKHNDGDQHVWQSTANSVFTVSEDPRGNTLGRGTSIILHLKEDASEFLDQSTLERIVGKYSEFINFPIFLSVTKTVSEEVPVPEEEAAAEEKKDGEAKEEELEVKDEEEEKEKKPKTKTETREVQEWKKLNENKAIWTRSPKDVTKEEYEAFYKALTKDEGGVLEHLHFSAEGEISFRSILYVPKTSSHDMYDKYYAKSNALKLYVRRVLISDEFEDFMPRYLGFIRGVVDSEDLPLNVNREQLSKNKVLKVMGKKLTRKALDLLKSIADDSDRAARNESAVSSETEGEQAEKKEEVPMEERKEKYTKLFSQFGKSIKLGCIEDSSNRAKLVKLLRYETSTSEDKMVSLQSYVDRMKPKQSHIYYLSGEGSNAIKHSPFLERLNKRGYEVVFMTDPLDEYVMSNVMEFEGKKFMSAAKEGLKFGDESDAHAAREKALLEEFKPLTEWLKTVYGDKVEKVVMSNRVSKSPAVLVTSQWGWSANMERIMRAQTFSDVERQKYMLSKKTMEINPRHPVIKTLKEKAVSSPDEASVKDLANLMYDTALLTSGFNVGDLNDFGQRMSRILAGGLGVDPEAVVEDEPEPEPEPETETETETESEGEGEAEAQAEEPAVEHDVPADRAESKEEL